MPTARVSALFCAMLLLTCFVSRAVGASSWIASIDERNGLPTLTLGGNTALSSDFVFWGRNWAWADLPLEFKVVAPFEYASTGKNKPLNFNLAVRAKKVTSQQVVLEFAFDALSSTQDIIGGGISFKLNLQSFSTQL